MSTFRPASRMRARAVGHAWLGPAFDALLLMRPRQWPILTCQFAVGVLVSPACLAALLDPAARAMARPWPGLLWAWLAWVVGLNGGTLAFNSAFDRDSSDIAYLRQPPPPPPHLATISFIMMVGAACLAWQLSPPLGWLTAGCVTLSVLYSHPRTRWKGVPGLDLAVNMLGYGAGTTAAGLLTGSICFATAPASITLASWLLVAGFALLFGSFYPLTQIYQLAADRCRGDRTLAAALGVRASLNLSMALGAGAAAAILANCRLWSAGSASWSTLPVGAALAAWLTHVCSWRWRGRDWSSRQHERGMYRALALWVLVDLTVLWSRYAAGWPD